ncbi:hypothetical protein D9619_008512 [Psilocybe cf. subviscida]|uniref:G protein alpha subunit n=1 Tax=Psilocybe cf. subviscida TaxID=2480587 RepID=A0A8H5F0K6_9AGAR|nr:hypothetical protein D9619_008512 [Psilocybe cf. subviscida]
MRFAPEHFDSERPRWKTIIYLNIIAAIKTIFDALEEERKDSGQFNEASMRAYLCVRLGLSPLGIIEVLAPMCKDSRAVVKSGSGWKTLLPTKLLPFSAGGGCSRLGTEKDPLSILIAQKDNIEALWLEDEIQQILSRRRPRLRQSPGLFMDDISRILTPDYVPNDSDILRARTRTMGVEEHYFCVERRVFPSGAESEVNYHIIEVGDSRSQRASWASLFNNVDTIVCLAPLLFNEFLKEERNINRLEDSILLWKETCENKLLAKAPIVLFLNKMDILAATLQVGVQVKRYVASYGNRPNDLPHVTKYFRDKFRDFHRKYSPGPRSLFCHETYAINIDSIGIIIASVGEHILYQHLRSGGLV